MKFFGIATTKQQICLKKKHVIKFSKRSSIRQIRETSIGQGRFIFTLAFAEFVSLAGEGGEKFWTHGIASISSAE